MKFKACFIFALASMTAAPVFAQTATSNAPAPIVDAAQPAAVSASTNETAAASAKQSKPKPKRKATVKKTVVLNPPATATVKADVLDVRGQGSFTGEVIGHVNKGDTVTVLEEITLGRTRPDEPAHWSKIVMPTNIPVWVDGAYVKSNMVHASRVNLRGGPGENYSIVGRLPKGAPINSTGEKGGWLKIEAPTNAYAFVASEYLEKQEAPAVAVNPTPAPAPTPAPEPAPAPAPAPATQPTVVENVPAAPATPAPATTVAPTPAIQASPTPAPTPAPAETAPAPQPEAKPEIPRVVTREGFVHRCYNIAAPAGFELHDIKTGDLIEYLQPAAKQKLKEYVGTRVRVVGTEGLDPRWPRTPILQIQTIDLIP